MMMEEEEGTQQLGREVKSQEEQETELRDRLFEFVLKRQGEANAKEAAKVENGLEGLAKMVAREAEKEKGNTSTPVVERHEHAVQIQGMRCSTSSLQGHGVDEQEALAQALKNSLATETEEKMMGPKPGEPVERRCRKKPEGLEPRCRSRGQGRKEQERRRAQRKPDRHWERSRGRTSKSSSSTKPAS